MQWRSLRNRAEAGRRLAELLSPYANRPEVVILALPRGGIPVAVEVSKKLLLNWNTLPVCKVSLPDQPEVAIGAIAQGGVQLRPAGIPLEVWQRLTRQLEPELNRRAQAYQRKQSSPVAEPIILLVDDGIATGATMRAAIAAVRSLHPQKIVVVAPVAPPSVVAQLSKEVEQVVVLHQPESFGSVSLWYDDFRQVSDLEVEHLLRQ